MRGFLENVAICLIVYAVLYGVFGFDRHVSAGWAIIAFFLASFA